MARLELIANRRKAQLELELAVAKLENERRKKQLLERQLENEQLTHRYYRKKIDKWFLAGQVQCRLESSAVRCAADGAAVDGVLKVVGNRT